MSSIHKDKLLMPKPGGVRWTVPGSYGDQKIAGKWSWPTFDEAVAAARSEISRIDYPGQTPDHAFTRAFVALRAEADIVSDYGTDCEIMRFEVFQDRVVLVPENQGGLSDEQAAAAKAANLTKRFNHDPTR